MDVRSRSFLLLAFKISIHWYYFMAASQLAYSSNNWWTLWHFSFLFRHKQSYYGHSDTCLLNLFSLGYVPRVELLIYNCMPIFKFIRYCQIIFQCCTNVYSTNNTWEFLLPCILTNTQNFKLTEDHFIHSILVNVACVIRKNTYSADTRKGKCQLGQVGW